MPNKERRKIRYDRLLLLIVVFCLIVFLFVLGIKGVISLFKDDYVFEQDELKINEIDYTSMQELDLELYSKAYMVVHLNDLKVVYGKDVDKQFYPASLTKVLTLISVCDNFSNYEKTSYISDSDYQELINLNASLAGLKTNHNYSLEDLLYALILPSGGDAARALENYFTNHNLNLVEEMNRLLNKLNLTNSHFTNTTGLHDNNLYTTLSDYALIMIEALKNDEAKKILKSNERTLSDGLVVKSTLSSLVDYDENIKVYGGKTGFTGEAGENIVVLVDINNDSYLIILARADGNPYLPNQQYHLKDAENIIKYLYN